MNPGFGPARISPLATLPLFHRLQGRKVVLAAGSPGALWKAELVSAAGARLLVLAGDEPSATRFACLAGATASVLPRSWVPEDFEGAVLALADPAGAGEISRFVEAAHSCGALVNIIDRPEHCDVRFGAIVNRSPIVVGISTDGGAPVLGQSLRSRIEAVLPFGLSGWAHAARRWRPRIAAMLPDGANRHAFWQLFAHRALARADHRPDETDLHLLLDRTTCRKRQGRVILVGAGPGDPELLTLKALGALQSATVILHDELVGPGILELARREARRVAVGKRGHRPSWSQQAISARLVELARKGETVVRLKGGDPLIFGRAAEEIEACRRAGIPVTIVPGISAPQGAAAALGFSLTERRLARRVQLVTGHGADGKLPDDLDWASIADPSATTIVYMPRRTLGEFLESAVNAGLDRATPVVAVASATLPGQAHVTGTVDQIPVRAEALPAGAPVILILGKVARHAAAGDRLRQAA